MILLNKNQMPHIFDWFQSFGSMHILYQLSYHSLYMYVVS